MATGCVYIETQQEEENRLMLTKRYYESVEEIKTKILLNFDFEKFLFLIKADESWDLDEAFIFNNKESVISFLEEANPCEFFNFYSCEYGKDLNDKHIILKSPCC